MEEMTTEQEDSIGEANVFALHPDGFRVHFKLRTGTPESVIKEMNRLVKGLMVGGYKPDEMNRSAPSAPSAAQQPAQGGEPVWIKAEGNAPPRCSIHGPAEWKEGTSKDSGKPYAFWSCKTRGCRPKGQPT